MNISHNSNNSEQTALSWGPAGTHPLSPPEIWNAPFKELDGNVPILQSLLLLNNQTQRQRPLAGGKEQKIKGREKNKTTEQSYNKTPQDKETKKKNKENKLKYTIHNVKIQTR